MAKKRMYSFAKEKHSGKGILSTILGTLSLVIFAVLAWLAYYLDGQGGVYLGSIGLLGMVFAVSSVVFGLMGFGENNVRYLFPKIGSILGGIMVGFKEMPGTNCGSTKYGTIRMASLYCNL